MSAKATTPAAIVDAWFREKIATGEIARHTPAYNHAFAAKADLVARLDAAEAAASGEAAQPVAHAAIVGVWFQQQLLKGEMALHAPAGDQAAEAKADLIARLTAAADAHAPPAKPKK